MSKWQATNKADPSRIFVYDTDDMEIWPEFPESDWTYAAFEPPPVESIPTVYGGRRDLTKYEFRNLFTDAEQINIDKLNANYMEMTLPDNVKDGIRTGLANYDVAQDISLDDQRTVSTLGLYQMLGFLTPQRVLEILNG